MQIFDAQTVTNAITAVASSLGAGGLLVVFLKRYIHENDEQKKANAAANEKLANAIHEIQLVIKDLMTKNAAYGEFKEIDRRMDAIEKSQTTIEMDIRYIREQRARA